MNEILLELDDFLDLSKEFYPRAMFKEFNDIVHSFDVFDIQSRYDIYISTAVNSTNPEIINSVIDYMKTNHVIYGTKDHHKKNILNILPNPNDFNFDSRGIYFEFLNDEVNNLKDFLIKNEKKFIEIAIKHNDTFSIVVDQIDQVISGEVTYSPEGVHSDIRINVDYSKPRRLLVCANIIHLSGYSQDNKYGIRLIYKNDTNEKTHPAIKKIVRQIKKDRIAQKNFPEWMSLDEARDAVHALMHHLKIHTANEISYEDIYLVCEPEILLFEDTLNRFNLHFKENKDLQEELVTNGYNGYVLLQSNNNSINFNDSYYQFLKFLQHQIDEVQKELKFLIIGEHVSAELIMNTTSIKGKIIIQIDLRTNESIRNSFNVLKFIDKGFKSQSIEILVYNHNLEDKGENL